MNKKYTNATFTKRVDHEAGRHRPLRAQPEPMVCARCSAVYRKRRWLANGDANIDRAKLGLARVTVCPACQTSESGVPSG